MRKRWLHGKIRLHLSAVLTLAVIAVSACTPNSSDYDNEEGRLQISKLGKMMGAEFPPGSKIVFADRNERNNESCDYHIVYSPSPVKFNEPAVATTSAEDSWKALKKIYHVKNLGEITDKWTYHFEGPVGKGSWNARQTHFETGSYLVVSQVFLGWAN